MHSTQFHSSEIVIIYSQFYNYTSVQYAQSYAYRKVILFLILKPSSTVLWPQTFLYKVNI